MPPEWEIEEYVDDGDGRPIRDFMRHLTPAEQGRLRTRLRYLRMNGLRAGGHVIKNLTGKAGDPRRKLWELRLENSPHNPRILFFPTVGRRFVLLHGFKKIGRSNDRIPERDIAIALDRMRDHLER